MNPTIAVIDDDACVRRAFSRLLHAAGFEVQLYSDAQEFLDSELDGQPDCIVLDLHMPGLSGLELQRKLNSRGTRIPLIVITADMDMQACRTSMNDGAIAWLRKPVDGPTLIGCLERAVAESRQFSIHERRLVAGAR